MTPPHFLACQQLTGHDVLTVVDELTKAVRSYNRRTRTSRVPDALALAIEDVPGLGPCITLRTPVAAPESRPLAEVNASAAEATAAPVAGTGGPARPNPTPLALAGSRGGR